MKAIAHGEFGSPDVLETGRARGKVVISVTPKQAVPESHDTLQEQGRGVMTGA